MVVFRKKKDRGWAMMIVPSKGFCDIVYFVNEFTMPNIGMPVKWLFVFS